MTTGILLEQVRVYAAAVRAHLADLGPEMVEDLTDDLEANLADALDDAGAPTPGRPSGSPGTPSRPPAGDDEDDDGAAARAVDLTRRFGAPADYAAELRAAAGLDPARLGGRQSLWRPGTWWQRLRSQRARLGTSRYGPGLAALRESVRPVWWVTRGWLWYVALMAVTRASMGQPYVPQTWVAWLGLGMLVVASVHLGRGWRRTSPWVRWLRVALTVVAILVLPWATTGLRGLISTATADEDGPSYAYAENGVWVEGRLVRNLFAYDADGNLLSAVQLFDETGRPVQTVDASTVDPRGQFFDASNPDVWIPTPATDVFGGERWNVYPLAGAPTSRWSWDEYGRLVLPDGVEPAAPPAPFARATAVVVPEAPASEDDASAASEPGQSPNGEEPEGSTP